MDPGIYSGLKVEAVSTASREFMGEDKYIASIKPSRIAERMAREAGYSPVLVEKYIQILGDEEEAREIIKWNDKPLPETIRCNDFLIPCSELESMLSQKGFTLSRIPWLPHGIEVLEQPIRVGATHEYMQGLYYIQDPGSMLVAYLLGAEPGEVVLDMAAAPGGKSTHIQQLSRDSTTLVAVDISRRRMRALRSHMQRMGFRSYVALRADSRMLTSIAGAGWADKVLLDAPSTGEGIIRKDPERRRSRSQLDVLKVHYLQLELLYTAVDLARPGAPILYAACSTSPEEGELVISRLLRLRSDVEVETLEAPIGSPGVETYLGMEMEGEVRKCLRLWPHRHGTEGFFICRLKRKG
ncbi:RsmB/NOP family class I SAM-dependent RNA methyltransferase [Aeropyrum camini]|uniref:RNA (Cytosine-C(5)-)-methyltransferase n=1 Tax=Aeropyrum camini SY1 = JCM 12091 TaxID=1198449 RepID=U3TBR6_9CREN|nr:RsmB/NOP family class I SAM-dependent RNA methyltransferase [Aeropyrum camini]BAN89866.1 RNA (cytosine-C(5)-)-methyltransferase [Aeropyrum camini SY1 = JCM 12091]